MLWNSVELGRVASGQDESAPIPVRWQAKVITDIAEYMGKVAIRYPVRSGPRVWSAEETAAWEGKVLTAVEALEALAAEVPAGTVTLHRVEDVLTDLRELSAFPTHELHHQLVAAFL